ncbi:N5-glutamine methyltransferase family protein [Massilia litorea]|uniref:Class I SAM-dependent methyltransferase n=1 Tax=Massilia litorea TaxID=2769491 RepID=A0A7L9U5J3_9BURK|nr:class I SAM-dependent methyltransferase [Massilia litorea]QOL49326.1 class I SAM-dependent methyltransferase [Massilia litorea]
MTAILHDPDALLALGQALQQAGYQFTTVTPATHRRVNGRPENAMARDLRGVFGWSRPFREATVPAAMLALMRRAGVLNERGDRLCATVRASTIGTCLYFHSAFPTHDEDAVFFGPDTYRYVAALKRAMADLAPPRRAVDIGAGGGPGAIEVAAYFPACETVAADINDRALALAGVNARLAGTANVQVRHSDLLNDLDGEFDLVLSNPPYILDPDKLRYRHGGEMRGAGLSLQIVDAALERLAAGGTLLLYTGIAIVDGRDEFLDTIRPRLEAACESWSYEELDPDIFGGQLDCEGYEEVERIAAVWLRATKRG